MADRTFADILKDSDIALAEQQVEYKLIEDGNYEAEITEAKLKVSAAGNTYIALTLTLDGSNRKVWYNINFSENEQSRAITLRTLKSIGLDPAALKEAAADPEAVFIGKRVEARIEHHTYEGKDRNNVRWINPIAGVDYTTDLKAVSASSASAPSSPF